MNKSRWTLPAFVLIALIASPVFAQGWKGTNRLQGVVLDANGKPVADAVVKLRSGRAGDTGPDVKTDKRGKWAVLGLISGPWNIDIEAPGFMTRQLSASISEGERKPALEVRLEPEPEPEPVPEATVASTVPPEAVAAVTAGETLMNEQKYKEAIVEFEKAQALLPEHMQLKQVLARAYYGAGQVKPAIALLKQVFDGDPTNTGVLLLLTNLLIEDGQLEEGKAMLLKVPEGMMNDPTALINLGILFLNKNQPSDAFEWLDRAVKIDEARGESYYYRGLAEIQMKKMKEARADFEKVVALAPDSTEAKDAAEMLKSLK